MTTLQAAPAAPLVPEQAPALEPGASPRTSAFDSVLRSWCKGIGRCLGSAGELVSGRLPDGTAFHCTLPFQRISVVEVRLRASGETVVRGSESRPHLEAALLATALELGLGSVEVQVRHRIEIPTHVGLATSSADVVAGIRAVAAAVGADLGEDVVGRLAASVLPAAGLAFGGLALVRTATGERLPASTWRPQFALAVLHPDDETLVAPDVEEALLAADRSSDHAALLSRLQAALSSEDAFEVAACATESARLRRELAPHPLLDVVNSLRDELAAAGVAPLGVAVSHSGSAVALLYPTTPQGRSAAALVGRVVRSTGAPVCSVASVTPRPPLA